MITKKCSKCGIEKPLDKFWKDKKRKDGKHPQCISCVKEYRNKNKEKQSIMFKNYRKNNVEKIRNDQKKHYINNKPEILEYQKKYQKENIEKVYKILDKYKERHPDRIKKYKKKYREKEESKEKMRQWMKDNRNNNIEVRIKDSISGRIYKSLMKYFETKENKTIEYIGCSIGFFKEHIEKQFKNGMSWDNYGEWHLDHKRPCASFNLSDKEQQLKCFNYKNYQPLWAKENISKGSLYKGVRYRKGGASVLDTTEKT